MGAGRRWRARVFPWAAASGLVIPISVIGLHATSAGSSPSVVQDISQSADATSITVTPSATRAGNLLVLALGPRASSNGGATVSSITDNASAGSNTWVQAAQDLASAQRQSGDIYYVDPATSRSITTVTVTWGTLSTTNARFYEVSGIASSPLDEHYGADAYYSTSPTATTTTLAQPDEWAVAMIAFCCADTTISGITSGWTNDATVHNRGNSGNPTSEQSGNQNTSSTAPLTYAGTMSSGGKTWSAVIATFKAASGGTTSSSTTTSTSTDTTTTTISTITGTTTSTITGTTTSTITGTTTSVSTPASQLACPVVTNPVAGQTVTCTYH